MSISTTTNTPAPFYTSALDATWGFNENPWWNPGSGNIQISYQIAYDSNVNSIPLNTPYAESKINDYGYTVSGLGAGSGIYTDLIEKVTDYLATIINVEFIDTPHSNGLNTSSGYDLTLRMFSSEEHSFAVPHNFASAQLGADMVMGEYIDDYITSDPVTFGGAYYSGGYFSIYETFLHEFGHAMGLAHPHDDGGGTTTLFGGMDSGVATLMSYNDVPWNWTTFTPIDTYVLQAGNNYGANMNYRAGNDTYSSEFELPADSNAYNMAFTLWDAGGYDVIDFSGISSYSTSKIVLENLPSSSFSGPNYTGAMVNYADGKYALGFFAYGTEIEGFIGGAGSDDITGRKADDSLAGGAGDDMLSGNWGVDTLTGGEGRDTFIFRASIDKDDTITDFDTQEDTISLINWWGFTYDYDAISYTVNGIDTHITATATDSYTGMAADTTFVLKNITISSLDDIQFVMRGTDDVEGTGNLKWTAISDDDARYEEPFSFSYQDMVYGSTQDDYIDVGLHSDWVAAGSGHDTIYGDTGDDSLYGQEGNDAIAGMTGADFLYGGYDDDQLYGGDGDDLLIADENDGFFQGDDTLIGGMGNDTMTGGGSWSGGDVFKFSAGETGSDRITDFDLGADKLWFDDWALDYVFTDTTLSYGGGGSFLTIDWESSDGQFTGYNSIYFEGITISDLISLEDNLYIFSANPWTGDPSTGGGDTVGGGSNTFPGIAEPTVSNAAIMGTSGADTLHGDAGNNEIAAMGNDDKIYGEAGNDTLFGQDAEDSLYGGVGDDHLYGGSGQDYLHGGDGNDFLHGGTGRDRFFGGSGNDTMWGGSRDLSVDNVNDRYFFEGVFGHDTIIDYDTLISTDPKRDVIYLNGTYTIAHLQTDSPNPILHFYHEGNHGLTSTITFTDTDLTSTSQLKFDKAFYNGPAITFGAGDGSDRATEYDDYFTATDAAETIDGLGGSDMLSYANDTIGVRVTLNPNGSTGIGGLAEGDTIRNIEKVEGGHSADILTGSTGGQSLYGLGGSDSLSGGAGNDVLDGGAGNDTLAGGNDADTLDGGDGNDNASGGSGNDRVRGGTGNDTLSGNAGNDTVEGGAGNDILSGNEGNDLLSGGAGQDAYAYSYSIGGNFLGNDTITDFSLAEDVIRLTGSSYKAIFIEPSGSNGTRITIQRTDGETVGTVTLEGISFANAGQIQFDLSGSNRPPVYINGINGTGGNDLLIGTANGDYITGGFGEDTIEGRAGNDFIDGGSQNDMLWGEGGNDTLHGGEHEDELHGGDGSDVLVGGTWKEGGSMYDHNTLFGDAGNDRLTGAQGSDYLYGGSGNDTIESGLGMDIIYGGSGRDTFVVKATLNDSYYTDTALNYVMDFSRSEGDLADFRELASNGYRLTSHELVANAGYEFTFHNAATNHEQYIILVDVDYELVEGRDYLISSRQVQDDNIGTTFSMLTGGTSGGGNTSITQLSAQMDGIEMMFSAPVEETAAKASASTATELSGSEGNDMLVASSANITLLSGGAGNDFLFAQQGIHSMDGGEGIDTAIFDGSFAEFVLNQAGDDIFLTHTPTDASYLVDNIEVLVFADRSFALNNGEWM